MNLKKNAKVFTSKFVGAGPSSYKKENLLGCGLTKVEKHCSTLLHIQFSFGKIKKNFNMPPIQHLYNNTMTEI